MGTQKIKLVLPELSYQIVGCAFDVHNELGGGHHEKYYQRALAEAFKVRKIAFIEQAYYPLNYRGKTVGKQFVDFIVDSKVVVEIKKGYRFSKRHIDQILGYLKASKLSLAILINFGREAVSFKRVVNFSYS